MENQKKCSICGKMFTGWGNNTWPVMTGDNDTCCDECNDTVVIPARIEKLFKGRNIDGEK